MRICACRKANNVNVTTYKPSSSICRTRNTMDLPITAHRELHLQTGIRGKLRRLMNYFGSLLVKPRAKHVVSRFGRGSEAKIVLAERLEYGKTLWVRILTELPELGAHVRTTVRLTRVAPENAECPTHEPRPARHIESGVHVLRASCFNQTSEKTICMTGLNAGAMFLNVAKVSGRRDVSIVGLLNDTHCEKYEDLWAVMTLSEMSSVEIIHPFPPGCELNEACAIRDWDEVIDLIKKRSPLADKDVFQWTPLNWMMNGDINVAVLRVLEIYLEHIPDWKSIVVLLPDRLPDYGSADPLATVKFHYTILRILTPVQVSFYLMYYLFKHPSPFITMCLYRAGYSCEVVGVFPISSLKAGYIRIAPEDSVFFHPKSKSWRRKITDLFLYVDPWRKQQTPENAKYPYTFADSGAVPTLKALLIHELRQHMISQFPERSLHIGLSGLINFLPQTLVADLTLDGLFHGSWSFEYFHKSLEYIYT